jgi:ammonium transporter, Amt family
MKRNMKRIWMRWLPGVLGIAITMATTVAVPMIALAADEVAETAGTEAVVAPEDGLDRGDHAWMLTSSALVLMMTAPGLALFYSGLVRKKNVLGVMMQCVFLMGLMTVIWALYGYTLSFGGEGSFIGNGEFLFMNNVQMVDGVAPLEGSIPRLTHMLFQGMFFIITPALIVGAFAERMKFSTMVVFMVLWGTLVYCPLCHWVWDGGILCDGNPTFELGGALDFAGGTVVHISSGISALVCALLIGRRLGFGSDPMPPHNLTYTAIGATMLWVGWFGFNAGSALAADGLAASAFAATHFAAAAGCLAWSGCEWALRGKPSLLGACSGLVAGLVCITPGSGFVQPISGIFIGLIGGAGCFLACTAVKSRFGYDDSLDVFGVHGVGGTLGAILTGVFATRHVADVRGGGPVGLIEGGTVIVNQIVATAITWALAIVVTFVLLKILDATMGLRVAQDEEIQGLDLSQHGEEGYIFI